MSKNAQNVQKCPKSQNISKHYEIKQKEKYFFPEKDMKKIVTLRTSRRSSQSKTLFFKKSFIQFFSQSCTSKIPDIVEAQTSEVEEEDDKNKSVVSKKSMIEKDVQFVEDVITEGLSVETSVSTMTPLRRSRRTSASSTDSKASTISQKTQETPSKRRGRPPKSVQDDTIGILLRFFKKKSLYLL